MVPVYRKFVQQHYRLSAYLLTNGANAVDSKCFFVALLASLCFFCCICYFPFVSSVFFLSTFVLMFIFYYSQHECDPSVGLSHHC